MPKPPLPGQPIKEPQGTGQRLRPYEYKERNKGMYNSSMNSSSNNSTLKQLSSFARQVKESGDAVGPEKKPPMNMLTPNQTAPGGQFPGSGPRDLKLATSAIFMNSKGNESEFHKFPSFPLTPNPSSQEPRPGSLGTSDLGKQPTVETAAEKKQRELMEIKKQLDELSKKIVQQSDKKKQLPNNNMGAQSQLRPPRPAGVSQSVIIESNSPQSYGGFGSSPLGSQFGSTQLSQFGNSQFNKTMPMGFEDMGRKTNQN
jgi:hypothetical protein